uniref:Uncharacterized protein n=1 Tax=viral metagenome TaxID=1070528 RepID=A0A6C0ASE5_9ZZZZ
MDNEYLRAFVIGSSCLVFLPYFFCVLQFKKKDFNFSYKSYTFLAPVALGLMNVLSLFLAKQFNLSKENRYLLISVLAPTLVLATIILLKVYNYTRQKWASHIINLYIFYFIIWNLLVYNLDKYI